MTRFSESEDSETIYYVTQLVAALYFIEHLEASSLKMDPGEFHSRFDRATGSPMAGGVKGSPAIRLRLRRSSEARSQFALEPDVSGIHELCSVDVNSSNCTDRF